MAMSQRDANQVLRYSYSDADEALKIVPSSSTSFEIELDATDGDTVGIRSMAVDNTVLQDEIASGTDNTSSAVDISNYTKVFVMILSTSLDAADGVVKMQASSDGTNFVDISSKSVTLSAGSAVDALELTDAPYAYFRLVYTSNTNATGTITTQYNLKA